MKPVLLRRVDGLLEAVEVHLPVAWAATLRAQADRLNLPVFWRNAQFMLKALRSVGLRGMAAWKHYLPVHAGLLHSFHTIPCENGAGGKELTTGSTEG